MMEKDLEGLRILIERNFQLLEKKVEENDQNIKKLLTKVEQENDVYSRTIPIDDIPVISYLDE